MQEPEMICELDYKYRKMNFPMTFDFLDVICFPCYLFLKALVSRIAFWGDNGIFK